MRGEHEVKKMHFIYLGVNVFSTKVLGSTTGDNFYVSY